MKHINVILIMTTILFTGCGAEKKEADSITNVTVPGGGDLMDKLSERLDNIFEKSKDLQKEISDKNKDALTSEIANEFIDELEEEVKGAAQDVSDKIKQELDQETIDQLKADLDEKRDKIIELVTEAKEKSLKELDESKVKRLFRKIRDAQAKLRKSEKKISKDVKSNGMKTKNQLQVYEEILDFAMDTLELKKSEAQAFVKKILQEEANASLVFETYKRTYLQAIRSGMTKENAMKLAEAVLGLQTPEEERKEKEE